MDLLCVKQILGGIFRGKVKEIGRREKNKEIRDVKE